MILSNSIHLIIINVISFGSVKMRFVLVAGLLLTIFKLKKTKLYVFLSPSQSIFFCQEQNLLFSISMERKKTHAFAVNPVF